AVAAVLLALVQVGRMVTGEGVTARRNQEYKAGNEVTATLAQAPSASSDALAAVHKYDNRHDKEIDRLTAGQASARGQTALAPAAAPAKAKDEKQKTAEVERTIVTGSNIPTAEEATSADAYQAQDKGQSPPEQSGVGNRKLIRNANVELEIVSFD